MQRGNLFLDYEPPLGDPSGQDLSMEEAGVVANMGAELYLPAWTMGPPLDESRPPNGRVTAVTGGSVIEAMRHKASFSVADFVEHVFIPGYVMSKKTAGRAHFQAILKHILSPERASQAFRPGSKPRLRLRARPDWPYLDNVPMADVKPDDVACLINAAMNRGYSTQMVTHLRNVIRNIFSHAAACGYFTGPNPAAVVSVPSIAHKPVPTLTLPQLKQAFELMRYPERQIALFALLTDMNVAEICGLKWKYVNLSNDRHYVLGEPLPARTIAAKMRSYRGEYGSVVGTRDRLIRIPEMLHSALQQVKHRTEYPSSDDFVLASRRGTPINPDNIAMRRLKWIGHRLGVRGLSWKVFHRTGIALQEQFGRYMHREIEKAFALQEVKS